MEIIRLVALFLLLSLLLVSCSAEPKDPLFYQEKSFRAHVAWLFGSKNTSAIVTNRPDQNFLSIDFTSPPSLSGISVRKSGEEISITLGDMKLNSPESSPLFELLKIFEISGIMTKSSLETVSGVKFNRIEILDNEKNENFILYLYKSSGLPRKIISSLGANEITFEIISFESIQ